MGEHRRTQVVLNAMAAPMTDHSCNMNVGTLVQFLQSEKLIRQSRHLSQKVVKQQGHNAMNIESMQRATEGNFLYRTFSLALVVDVEERLHILGVDLNREVIHNPADGTTREFTRADRQRTFREVAFVEPC